MTVSRIVNDRERVHSLTGPEIATRIVQCIVAEELVSHSPAYLVHLNRNWGVVRVGDSYSMIILIQKLRESGFFGTVAISYTEAILPGVVDIRAERQLLQKSQAGRVTDPASRERSTDH